MEKSDAISGERFSYKYKHTEYVAKEDISRKFISRETQPQRDTHTFIDTHKQQKSHLLCTSASFYETWQGECLDKRNIFTKSDKN